MKPLLAPSLPRSQAPRVFALGLIAIILFLLAGCIPSLSPIFEKQDLVTDPGLLGKWNVNGSADSEIETWIFEGAGDPSYRLTISHVKKSSPLVAHLASLGEYRFLDLFPDSEPLDSLPVGDYFRASLVPAHLFFKITRQGDTLVLHGLDLDWLKARLKSDPACLAHAWLGDQRDDLVLTASTKELRAFLLQHVGNPDALKQHLSLKRVPEPAP
jgi:hypothetical protein